jgi:Dyp-type peroxidase family
MDLSDIQGLVLHAYRRLPYAAYVLLRFEQQSGAVKRWLRVLVESGSVDSATPKDVGPPGRPGVRLNIAFTYTGLAALALDPDALATFPSAFAEGLGAAWPDGTPDHRSRILGDVDASEPRLWDWGSHSNRTWVDALLIVFAADPKGLNDEISSWTDLAVRFGAIAPNSARTRYGNFPVSPDTPNREPFGFVDGISQPVLKGARSQLRKKEQPAQPPIHELEDGEMLLGHRNGARQISFSPTIASSADPDGLLRAAHDDPDRRDVGYNGTYLVFRQLAQDVEAFNKACEDLSDRVGVPKDRFAAMVVGRWQDGSPIMKCPIAHDPMLAEAPAANDFSYSGDPHGERCPIGSHIRRANPRDSLGDDAEESWKVANRHRILRRGRPYDNGREQGLHFISLQADITRQFEFIQQNWINADTFGGLDAEDDPLVGSRQGHAVRGRLTLPPPPEDHVRRRVVGLQRFVTVKGGGYFFMPSLTALRYLAVDAPRVPARTMVWKPEPPKLTRTEWIRFLFLTRSSILLALLLAGAPLALLERSGLSTIARPMFLVSQPWELFAVTALASLAASVALITWRLVQLYATRRFDASTPRPFGLTWRRVLKWQAVSLPIVGATFWLSAADAAGRLARNRLWFGLAALGGYAAAYGVLFAASAARNRTVRPDNPDDALFLPSSRILDWLKNKPSLAIWCLRPVMRIAETRAATWPPDLAAGYIDPKTGRILPGHVAAMMAIVTIALIYLNGWWLLRPPAPRVGFQLPPMAYLLFVLLTAGWMAASAAFFLDRFRIPLMTVLSAWLLIAAGFRGTDHEFKVFGPLNSGAPSIASTIASADDYDRTRGGVNSAARPLIVVAAGGGGVHQAAWTARVLTGLTDLWGAAFAGNLRLISGVSAGSVGAMYYVNQYTENGPPTGGAQVDGRDPVGDAAKAPSTGDIWWGLAYPDLTRILLPFSVQRILPGWWDRGWALEQSWHRELGLGPRMPSPTIQMWQDDVVRGWRPSIAFNAMVVETGQRVVLSTYAIPDGAATKGLAEVTGSRDLSVITAARLSASFPYVTPFARPSDGPKMFHLTDGGYWDNHAVVSALEWIRTARAAAGTRPILVVQIPPSPIPEVRSADRAWVWQLSAPLVALETVRINAQAARNKLEIELLNDQRITWVEIPYRDGAVSLGWHLSRRERCTIDDVWRKKYGGGGAAIEKIAGILGPPAPVAPAKPVECAHHDS